jgi:hypothetical protein
MDGDQRGDAGEEPEADIAGDGSAKADAADDHDE